jgi:lipopolysaccharide/colanic/teichoic acid biosynthesis glycosyltransferase
MCVLVYMESPGPVFYRQKRRGLGEKEFDMIKLRSMRLDAEADGVLITVENDPRRLKIGTLMRSWNLDELPQFWNVLRGDMSLVGPRPERLESVDKYEDTIRYYNLRHTCKPGLTGWAAVHGLRGNTSIEERIEYDLYYVENWSLLLDLKIMFLTLSPPKNAY